MVDRLLTGSALRASIGRQFHRERHRCAASCSPALASKRSASTGNRRLAHRDTCTRDDEADEFLPRRRLVVEVERALLSGTMRASVQSVRKTLWLLSSSRTSRAAGSRVAGERCDDETVGCFFSRWQRRNVVGEALEADQPAKNDFSRDLFRTAIEVPPRRSIERRVELRSRSPWRAGASARGRARQRCAFGGVREQGQGWCIASTKRWANRKTG